MFCYSIYTFLTDENWCRESVLFTFLCSDVQSVNWIRIELRRKLNICVHLIAQCLYTVQLNYYLSTLTAMNWFCELYIKNTLQVIIDWKLNSNRKTAIRKTKWSICWKYSFFTRCIANRLCQYHVQSLSLK